MYVLTNASISSGTLAFGNPTVSNLYGLAFKLIIKILSPSIIDSYCLSNLLNLSKSLYRTAALVLAGAFNLNELNFSP
jgi:hypothetical protein